MEPSVTTAASTPFVLERVRRDEGSGGHFVPDARLLLTPAVRTSGWLATLSDEAARTLLAVLSFVTPNGYIQPGTEQIAEALGVPEPAARERLRKLTAITFDGVPLLHQITQGTGRVTCVVSRRLVTVKEAQSEPADVVNLPIPQVSHRDAIIEHSRSQYAKPRAEVERIVAQQLGHDPEDSADSDEGKLRRRLLAVGIPREQVHRLVAKFPHDGIERQLDWLPYRNAKDPARFLVAAIEGQYNAPPLARVDEVMAQQEKPQAFPVDIP